MKSSLQPKQNGEKKDFITLLSKLTGLNGQNDDLSLSLSAFYHDLVSVMRDEVKFGKVGKALKVPHDEGLGCWRWKIESS